MRYVKRSDKFSFIEKDKVTIGKNMWGKNSLCSSNNLFQKMSYNMYNGKMNVKMMELAEEVKLIVLVKEYTLINFVSSWKLLFFKKKEQKSDLI